MREGEPRPEIKKQKWTVEHFELIGKRDEMQDASGTVVIERSGAPVLIATVGDGHGLEGGVAANLSVEGMLAAAQSTKENLDAAWLVGHFETLENRIEKDKIIGGTTLTVLVLRGDRLTIGYVGDSEVRSIGATGQLTRLMRPHRAREHADERARLQSSNVLIEGKIVPPDTNRYIAVTRALGDTIFEPYIRHDPEIVEATLPPGTRFLVAASDGLWDLAPQNLFADTKTAEEVRQRIENFINTLNHPRQDNVIAEIIDLGGH